MDDYQIHYCFITYIENIIVVVLMSRSCPVQIFMSFWYDIQPLVISVIIMVNMVILYLREVFN